MIKINLLPRKVTRKKLTVIRHSVLGGILLLVLVAALGFVWYTQNGRISTLKAEVAKAEKEKESLKNVNAEKQMHEKNIEDLKHRIDVISQIEKGRTIPIRVMDEITRHLDAKLPIWLTGMNYNGEKMTIDGYSFTNPDIAKLVTYLQQSPYLKNVELIISQKVTLQGKEVFRFSITGAVQKPQQGG